MIYLYYDEDRDERLIFMAGKIEGMIDFYDYEIHIYEHEGELSICEIGKNKKATDYLKEKIGDSTIYIGGDEWGIHFVEEKDFPKNLEITPNMGLPELNNADEYF